MSESINSFFKHRSSGILLHPSSLPGPSGIGTFGTEAFEFIDKLAESGVRFWQMLPLTPVGMGNSPYQSWSAFAGNHLFISQEKLIEDGFLSHEYNVHPKLISDQSSVADYKQTSEASDIFLRAAFQTYHEKQLLNDQFREFCSSEAFWLDEYVMFAAIRNTQQNKPLQDWPDGIKHKKPEFLTSIMDGLDNEFEFHRFVQFLFFKQWFSLKEYANAKNICIIGDLPIYVSADSAEVWHHPELFELDNELRPQFVAGVPPDYFSETGQLWGNPIYKWSTHEQFAFEWWHRRIEFSFCTYDAIRIDHFRGFSEFWSVPAGEETAENGTWVNTPGMKLFESLMLKHSSLPIIAEDLGVLSEDAIGLRNHFGYPGMKVLQFAFSDTFENLFLPHHYDKNCIVYTGTHDNNTTRGWLEEDATKHEKEAMLEYLNCTVDNVVESLIRLAWSSVANTVIIPAQDFFALGSSARMNIPGTTGGNWKWRMTHEQIQSFPVEKIQKLNRLFARSK